jgi:hypothetical protein
LLLQSLRIEGRSHGYVMTSPVGKCAIRGISFLSTEGRQEEGGR